MQDPSQPVVSPQHRLGRGRHVYPDHVPAAPQDCQVHTTVSLSEQHFETESSFCLCSDKGGVQTVEEQSQSQLFMQ